MADAAAKFASVFTNAGLPDDFIAQLTAASDWMIASLGEREQSRVTRRGATEGLCSRLQVGRKMVDVLDALVRSGVTRARDAACGSAGLMSRTLSSVPDAAALVSSHRRSDLPDMLKRSVALAFALILGPGITKAQDMGPFVKGRQYATMQQFDGAVVEWLLSRSSGKGEVALPRADRSSRNRSVRAATVAKSLSVSRYDAVACRNHAAECLRATDVVLAVYPVQHADADRFMAPYALIRRFSLQGHQQISDTVIHPYFIKNAEGIMVAGVITATTP